MAPKMVSVANHPNVELITYAEVKNVEGYIGNFEVTIEKKPRYVDENICTGCGACAAVCPIEVPNEFDLGLGTRKAIYVPFAQAVPLVYTIDMEHCIRCGLCEKACGPGAIRYDQKPEEIKLKVGTIICAVGYDEFDATLKEEYGYGVYDNVITTLELERMINPAGPTGGHEIRPSDGKHPHRVVFIQCVGSRDAKVGKPYCSRICCMFALKNAQLLKQHDPNTEVYICYMDIRAFGKGYEEYYRRAQEQFGVKFIRGRPACIMEDPETKNLIVRVEDTLLGEIVEIEADLVVLSAGLSPRPDNPKLAKMLGIELSPDGFFKELHPKLAPVNTKVDGVAIAGVAQGPKDIPDTVAQAKGAASAVSIPMAQGEFKIEMIRAVVDEDICGGCEVCAKMCPYNAITYVEKDGHKVAQVNDVACKGCGACAGACPSGAMQLRYYRDEQIISFIDGVLEAHQKLES
ncbi:CoB--CoM heterodisulfide reductase subunit A [Methanocaldococcus lauensis]|nr:CoB--CoM heterodisulfide reductase subunit A [Methanocaldococcus lauensis]